MGLEVLGLWAVGPEVFGFRASGFKGVRFWAVGARFSGLGLGASGSRMFGFSFRVQGGFWASMVGSAEHGFRGLGLRF